MADKIKSNLTQDDFYGWTENQLLLSGRLAGNVITLDPLSNDSPGNGKTLFSIDDGNGHTNLTDYDLLNADRNGVWESTSTGNRIRIINGKVEVDVGHSLAVLGATNVNSLRAGEHIHDEFVYALQAGNNGNLSQARITVDIYGENDAASIAGDSSRDVAEHATVPVTGTLTVTDADHGESHTQTVTNAASNNHLGTYSVDADGHWSYLVNNDAVKHLNANETATDTFTVFSLDHTASQQVTITIHGENDADAPLVTTPDASGSAGGNIELHITVTKTDPTETLGDVEIDGVPSGYALTAGTELDAGLWLVSVSDLPGLALTPVAATSPGEFVLHVTATSSDGTSTASTTADLDVTIEAANGSLSGRVVDGYIAGATVFADADNDGTLDADEAHTITNADGSFTLTGGSGPLVMFGGTDVSTGLAFDGVMTAPSGSTVVTPLTTLVVQLAATMSLAAAQDAVATAFGLDTNIDLQTFDPVPAAVIGNAAALAVLSAATQVQSTVTQVAAVAGSESDVITAIAHAITAANGGAVNLSQSAVVGSIATQAGVDPDAIAAVTAVVSAANASIQTATDVTKLAQAAQVAQGDATDALANTDFTNAGQVADLTQTYVTDLHTQIVNAEVGDVNGAQLGTLGDDILAGGNGSDSIDGLDGRDQINGGGGNDFLYGGAGYDTLIGGVDNDLVDGGSGIDRADYSNATSPITVDMAAGTVDGDASVGHDTLVSVEQIRATAFDDTYVATGYAGASFVGSLPPTFNEFEGMAGNDVITGNTGGNGGTLLSYLKAADSVTVNFTSWTAGQGASGTAAGTAAGDLANVGTDTFTGVQGVRGSDFSDTFHGSNNLTGVEVFQGRGGNDLIDGGGGFDRALYWFRTDDNVTGGITVNMAAGTVVGDASVGSDTLRSVEAVRATNFVDSYNATGFTTNNSNGPNVGSAGFFQIGSFQAAFNEFEGFGSNDSITGNGNTRIDYINATAAVTVDLQAGWATGDVSVGTDTIVGGVNSIQGSYYADTLSGSNNAPNTTESYDGGAGDDTIDGRGGFDQAYYNNAIATVSGIDVDMGAGTVDGDASIGHDTLRSIESVRGTNFADTYDATGFGQPGALNIGNSGTFNSFEGLAGNDTITGNGNTQLTFFNAGGGVTVNFSTGTVTGDASVGTDHFTGVNNVQGSNFNDTIIGTAGNQTFGGRGGADTFAYANNGGADVVSDFSHGQGDKIDLTGVTGIYDLADVQAIAAQLGPNTRIDFGGGNTLTLNNVTATSLVASDFIFAPVNHIVGDNNDNILVGTPGIDWIEGLGGNDALQGLGNDDLLDGGSEFDRAIYTDATSPIAVDLAAGTVTGDASVGTDTLISIEQIRGSDFVDTYVATGYTGVSPFGSVAAASNEFEGMADDDVITGNGFTLLSYLTATAGVTVDFALWIPGQGASGTATGDASVGIDTFTGVQGARGSEFADTLLGSNNLTGVEVFQGRGGDDYIDGRGGFDRSNYWHLTDDNVTGGITINLAAGTVDGDASVGHDILRSIESVRATNFVDSYNAAGFTTNPSLGPNFGSAGFFQIGSFQAAFNEFEGFGSNDIITGNGNTRIDYINATAAVTVDLQAGWATGDVSVGSDTITGGVNSIQGSYYDDTLYGSNNAPNTTESYDGGAGDDSIDGRGGFDQAYYNNAVGTVSGINVDLAAGTVLGDFSIGSDTLRSIESVRGTNFADTYVATGFNAFSTNAGSSGTFNQFEGLAGNDVITGNGITQLTFFNTTGGVTVNFSTGTATGDASVGTDTFTGVNNVQGSNFNDTLIGAAGNQTLAGRGGADTFVYADNGGADTITDFNHGQGDKINLIGVTGVDSLAAVQAIATQAGLNTVLDFGGGNTLQLNNVTAANLAASDFIFADNNDNTLIGTPANETLAGLGGHDTLQGLAGDDVLDGGSEIDRAIYTNATDGITVDLAAGTAHGTAPGDLAHVGIDTLVSIEQVGGSASADTYVAAGYTGISPIGSLQASFNEFEGMAGDDIIAGNGSTILLYLNANDGVAVNFTSWVAGQGASGTAIGDASVGTDTFTGVQGIRGSEFDDTFHGSNQLTGVEVFQGRGGNDWIDGGGGLDRSNYWFRTDDNVTGGITVNLAAGTVDGDTSVGHDTLRSIESVRATNFDDTYNAAGFTITTSVSAPNAGNAGSLLIGSFQAAFNEFEGFGGNDSITGNGNTRIDYINATAAVTVDLAAGTAQGTAAGDIANVGLDTFSGVNSVQGSYYDDHLYGSDNGTSSTESFDGGAGNDFIDGRGGFDQAYYTNAIGTVHGIDVTVTTDTVAGDAFQVVGDASIGTDTLIAVESVRGTNFVDTYNATGFNGASADLVLNGPHFNEFEGLGGNDIITGNGETGLAATRLTYVSASAGVTVDLAAGTAQGTAAGDIANVGHDTISGVNRVRGSNFNDTLSGDANDNILEGQNGNDILNGRGGNDTLSGGFNSDTFVYTDNGGADIVTDFFHAQADKINLIDVTGVDSLAAVQGIATQAGAHTVLDFGGGNTLTLNNVTAANLTASDFIFADNNDNILLGVPASETLAGLGGNDTLTGGGGNDTLSGGLGADHFHYDAPTDGLDQILDFNTAEGDLVEILGAAFGGLSTGTLDPSLFSTQTDGSFDNTTERFSFDQVSHTLYYDGDGSDAGSTAVAIAQFATGVNITNHEINVV